MANINSDLIQLRTVNRCHTEGAEQQFAATVKIPAGTTIAQNDTLSLAFPVTIPKEKKYMIHKRFNNYGKKDK